MESVNTFIHTRLIEREESLSLRTLSTNETGVDFCSNDYLGFARCDKLKLSIASQLAQTPAYRLGSTGSRLISGNDEFTEKLESEIAFFHHAEAALLFNSGYDANVGLFSSLPQRGDTIILDEFIHASIIDGARLSNANRYTFKHNDLNSLEEKLKFAKGNIFIGVESIYSMDGDASTLAAIAALAEAYSAALIVDEAHAAGIFGHNGRGLVHHLNLTDNVFARVVTFGKALGCHGAAVICSKRLQQYLINFARSFVYTTAASFHSHLSIRMAYKQLVTADLEVIHSKIKLFKKHTVDLRSQFIDSSSPIQSIIIPGNEKARDVAATLQKKGFNVRAILHPTVPLGKERLRICLHTFNTDEEITNLALALKTIL